MKKIFYLIFIMAIQMHAQWKQCNGPFGGGISAIAVYDANIFIITRAGWNSGSVFLSTNSGKNWKQLGSGLENHVLLDLAITADGSGIFALSDSGVFYSGNNGKSWSNIGPKSSETNITSLAVYPNDSGGTSVLVGTSNHGLFLSNNLGKNWEQMYRSFKHAVTTICAIGTRVITSTWDGIYISTDGGKSWRPSASSPKDSDGNIVSLFRVIPGHDSTTLFACGGGVFISKDNGENWTAVNSGLTNSWVNCLAVAGKNLFAGTGSSWLGNGSGVYRSTNNGTSWQYAGLDGMGIGAIAAQNSDDPSRVNLFAGADFDRGIFLSTNMGESWAEVNQGITNTAIEALAAYEDKTGNTRLFAGVRSKGILRSDDIGDSWIKSDSGLPPETPINSFAINNGKLIVGTFNGLFISSDYGNSWTDIFSNLPEYSSINKVFASNDSTGRMSIFAGSSMGLYRSTDTGKSWIAVNSGLPVSNRNFINAFAQIDPYIFLGFWSYTPDGNTSGGIFRSSDNGANWIKFSHGLPEYTTVYDIAIIGTNIFAASNYGIFLSTDNGTNWKNAASAYPEINYVNSFAVNKTNLFASSHRSVYMTTDNGANWKKINQGLPAAINLSMLTSSSTHLFLGTSGYGIWRLALPVIIADVKSPPEVPINFSLVQNYPNPFNPSTTIKYTLPYSSHVTLKIYDILGCEIGIILNEEQSAGIHSVTWKADNYSSGIYFYEIRAGGFIQARKMILLR